MNLNEVWINYEVFPIKNSANLDENNIFTILWFEKNEKTWDYHLYRYYWICDYINDDKMTWELISKEELEVASKQTMINSLVLKQKERDAIFNDKTIERLLLSLWEN